MKVMLAEEGSEYGQTCANVLRSYGYEATLVPKDGSEVISRLPIHTPDVLLMDEPFASLDFITRGELQAELLDIQKELQKTILLVTHQLDEALLLAQRIVVLHADSSVRVWELELPYPRDLTSPQLAALREEITAECRKD